MDAFYLLYGYLSMLYGIGTPFRWIYHTFYMDLLHLWYGFLIVLPMKTLVVCSCDKKTQITNSPSKKKKQKKTKKQQPTKKKKIQNKKKKKKRQTKKPIKKKKKKKNLTKKIQTQNRNKKSQQSLEYNKDFSHTKRYWLWWDH